MDCDATGLQIDTAFNFSIFNPVDNSLINTVHISAPTPDVYLLQKNTDDQCITGDQRGCYYKIVKYTSPVIELPITASGYIVAFQRCCRIENIVNITNSGQVGNTYSINIPGSLPGAGGEKNNSAVFLINDTSVVCAGTPFSIPFMASDADGDSLSYYFCDALTGASFADPGPAISSNPPFTSTPYQFPFAGVQPMGSGVTINSKTGIISGIAPSGIGEYVVSVCVNEYRKGKLVGRNRKELHVVVGNCNQIKSNPPIDYTTCDGYTINFTNTSTGPIQNYYWDFGDKTTLGDTSLLQTPTYTYADTGRFQVKLIVNRGSLCTDTGYTNIGIYPGFFPNFDYLSTCKGSPTQFIDKTTTKYGTVNLWHWDFGNTSVTNDTAILKNPAYTYDQSGNYNVQLIVGNSKGCIDTVLLTVPVLDRPTLKVTNDTLICDIDTLQLSAEGLGTFTWSPNYNINNLTSATPLVSPDVPTKYYVSLNAGPGCSNNDSVFVNVKKFVTLQPPKDTTICKGDPITLSPTSDALHYNWSPSATLNSDTAKNPVATPTVKTTYTVIGNIGKCQATAKVTVTPIPYPQVTGAGDKSICFDDSTQISAQITASSFSWSPLTDIINSNTLTPIVFPKNSTDYIITVRDTLGCPKPVSDTVSIIVIPPVQAFAGNDTDIVVNQPLQLTATGGEIYQWSPATGLNKSDIFNPIAVLQHNQQYIVRVSTQEGCFAFDTINVRVFTTPPSFFVPNAFTPNNDSRNDIIRPITAGLAQLYFFNIYNRWGQLVFSTNQSKVGWDGTLKGREQPMGVYVWVAKAITYEGNIIEGKGTITLIR